MPDGVDAAVHSAPPGSLPDVVRIVEDSSRIVTVIDDQGAAQLGLRKVDARNDSGLLRYAAALGADGIYTPRIDRELSLTDIVEAHTLAENGGGKVVITQP